MQTRRDWLVSKGLAKPGRGKFSNAAKEALAKAEADGIKFSDSSTAPTVKTSKPTEDKPDTVPASESSYLHPSDFRFPEGEYKAVGIDGKTYSMRECCNTCRVSLTNHACNAPTIHDNLTVNIREVR